MNRLLFTSTNKSSHVEIEDYFPLRVVYESSIEDTQFVGFYYGDSDLLELSIDNDSKIIKKLQLVICNHYVFTNDVFNNDLNCLSGSIGFDYTQHNECEAFQVTVYTNAVIIKLSDAEPKKYFSCGQVVFGFLDDNEVSSVIVTGMSAREIEHTKSELSLGSKS